MKYKDGEKFEARLAQLVESPTNPRKTFDPGRLAELASSVKSKGVLVPIMVRESPANPALHEIIAGARRYRAATMAKLETMPAIFTMHNDKEVSEIQLIENVQRDDLHPQEEGESYLRMIEELEYTPKIIAEKVSKDLNHVYRMLNLTQLVDSLRTSYVNAEFGLSHALRLSRLAPADQRQVEREGLYKTFNDGAGEKREVVTLKMLDAFIERSVLHPLSAVPWDKSDVTLVAVAGSCSACHKRTGANLVLFEDLQHSADRCLDNKCYEEKLKAHVAREQADANRRGEPLIQITKDFSPDMEKQPDVVPYTKFVEVEVETASCASMERALIVGETNKGHQQYICRDKHCPVHRKTKAKPERTIEEIWKEKEKVFNAEVKQEGREIAWCEIAKSFKGNLGTSGKQILTLLVVDLLTNSEQDMVRVAEQLDVDLGKKTPAEATLTELSKGIEAHLMDVDAADWARRVITAGLTPYLTLNPMGPETNILDRAMSYIGVSLKDATATARAQMWPRFAEKRKEARDKAKGKSKPGPAADAATTVTVTPMPKSNKTIAAIVDAGKAAVKALGNAAADVSAKLSPAALKAQRAAAKAETRAEWVDNGAAAVEREAAGADSATEARKSHSKKMNMFKVLKSVEADMAADPDAARRAKQAVDRKRQRKAKKERETGGAK